MDVSEHARVRMQQRAITPGDVAFIQENGTAWVAAGGAEAVMVSAHMLYRQIQYHQEQLRRLSPKKPRPKNQKRGSWQ